MEDRAAFVYRLTNTVTVVAKANSPERLTISKANLERAIASNVGRSPGVQTRERMSVWQIGKRHSAETKAKIAAKATGRKWTPGQMEKGRQRKFSPETRAKIKAALKGREFSQEWRARISEGLRRRWARYAEAKNGPLA